MTCPLTGKPMREPVFLFTQSGRSYERQALVSRLAEEPNVDPATHASLESPLVFAPNAWVAAEKGRSVAADDVARDVLETQFPGVGAALYEAVAWTDDKRRAASLSRLDVASRTNHAAVVKAGGVAVLGQVLEEFIDAQGPAERMLLSAVRALSSIPPDDCVTVVGPLVRVVESRDKHEQDNDEHIELWSRLSGAPPTYEAAVRASESSAVVEALVGLVNRSSDEKAQTLASRAILTLASVADAPATAEPSTVFDVLSGGTAGTMEPLVRLFNAAKSDDAKSALAKALAKFVATAQKSNPVDIQPLVWLMDHTSADAPADTTPHRSSPSGTSDEAMRALLRVVSTKKAAHPDDAECASSPPSTTRSLSSADPSSMDALEPLLFLLEQGGGTGSGDWGVKEAAAFGILKLARQSDERREEVAVRGAVPSLVRLIDRGGTDKAQTAAARALAVLIENDKARTAVADDETAIPAFVRLVNLARSDAGREAAVLLLDRIARGGGPPCAAVGQNNNVIASLTRLIYRGCTDRAEEAATHLLAVLATSDSHKLKIVEAGAITPLIKLLEFGETEEVKDAAGRVLKSLADYAKTRSAIARELNMRRSFAKRLFRKNERKSIHDKIDGIQRSMSGSS